MFYILNLQAFFARGKRNQLQSVEMPLNMRGKVLENASAVMHVSLKNDQSENGCDSLQKGQYCMLGLLLHGIICDCSRW